MPSSSKKLKVKSNSTRKSSASKMLPIGINYESGKIMTHILKFANCVGFANLQIAMDAPFHGRVADETVRSVGRSELQFPGYDEKKLVATLTTIFKAILAKHGADIKIVLQIARGRSAGPTFEEVIKPIFTELGISNYETKFGYRSKDYYVPADKTPFFYVNYGMFAVLSQVEKVAVGAICNPVISMPITKYTASKGFTVSKSKTKKFNSSKNILNSLQEIMKIRLYGIADDMAFITPDVYDIKHIEKLV